MEFRKLTHTFTSKEMLNLNRLHFLLHAIEKGELKIDEDSLRGESQRKMLEEGHKTIKVLLHEDDKIFKEDIKNLKAGL